MKKTKVILFILLCVLAIGVCTNVNAGSLKEYENGEIVYRGTPEEFLELSDEEKNTISTIYLFNSTEKIEFKDLHLENMKNLDSVCLLYISISTEEGVEPMPNVKTLMIDGVENVDGLLEKGKWSNLENLSIDLESKDSGLRFDLEKINNLENLKELSIWFEADNEINDIDDIDELPAIQRIEKLNLSFADFGDEYEKSVELKNIRNIPAKFTNLKELELTNIKVSYEDFIYITNEYEKIKFMETTIIKNHGKVEQGEEVLLNIPIEKLNTAFREEEGKRLSIIEGTNCSYKGEEIKLNTDKAGENEAIVKIGKDGSSELEIHIKYEVEEKEESVVEEPKQEESKPDKEQTNTSAPSEPVTGTGEKEITGGFLSKIINTIKNLINSIIEKITNLFKFKF